MFLTLLMVTQVVAEWVEISQQHYRKPIHTSSSYNPFTTQDKMEMEDTSKSWTHNNRNVSEYNRNKASNIQSNFGNLKRMQSLDVVKSTHRVSIQEDNNSNLESDELSLKTNYGPIGQTINSNKNVNQKGIIEKVPNIGNVKRVQLSNSPVKSPALNVKNNKEIAKNRYEELPLNNENEHESFVHQKVSDATSNSRRIYMNNLGNRKSTEHASNFSVDQNKGFSDGRHLRKRPKPTSKDYINPSKPSSKQTIIPQSEDVLQNAKYEDKLQKENTTKILEVTEEIFMTQASMMDEAIVTKNNNQSLTKIHKNVGSEIPHDIITDLANQPLNKVHQIEQTLNHNEIIDNDRRTLKEGNKSDIEGTVQLQNGINNKNFEHQYKKITQVVEESTFSKGKEPENKVGNLEDLRKIMKVVADTISQNTRRSFNGKMRYLHELKNSILNNIADRIDSVWPDDDATVSHRHSRSTQALPRGNHVQFPSSESALMTISFLTFAVFLIKLVLQLIHTYKNKAMMVAPVMVSASGRTVLTPTGHH